jgi:hypothetical protein
MSTRTLLRRVRKLAPPPCDFRALSDEQLHRQFRDLCGRLLSYAVFPDDLATRIRGALETDSAEEWEGLYPEMRVALKASAAARAAERPGR